jgi:hypothetical protein
MLKLRLTAPILALLLTACATAPPSSINGQILQSGICAHRDRSAYPQPQSTAGYATLGDLQITSEATVVPLRKNIGFGFRWRATGMPAEADVDFIIRHPTITRPDGTTLEGFVEPFNVEAEGGVVTRTDCYILSEDHELVAGTWSISVAYKGQTLVSREYEVRRE